jgi:DNA modification methylase
LKQYTIKKPQKWGSAIRMETTHKMVFGKANRMNAVADASVDSVVTSPPYLMIKMWDDVFAKHNPDVGDALRR